MVTAPSALVTCWAWPTETGSATAASPAKRSTLGSRRRRRSFRSITLLSRIMLLIPLCNRRSIAQGEKSRKRPSTRLEQHVPEARVQMVVGREDIAARQGVAAAAGIAHIAARFAHQQHAGGEVPGAEPIFPISVETPGGHIGEVECGGPHARTSATASIIASSWRR